MNGDGKMDVVASRGHGVGFVWFEGPGFVKHEIDASVYGPHSLAVADIDGDGDLDFVSCAKDSMVVVWFENDGKGKFTKRFIHEDQAAYDIRLVDLDLDGDLDVLVAGQTSKNVVWYENRLR
jgi:WD40 repeat protein